MRNFRTLGLAAALGSVMALAASPDANAQITYNFTNFDGPLSSGGTTINGISGNGTEVGFSIDAAGNNINFLRNPDGTFVTLNAINALSPMAMANGVNNTGIVVGTDGLGNAFAAQGNTGGLLSPADPGNTTSQIAFGINNANQIVGQYVNNNTGNTPGFLFSNGNFTLFNPTLAATVTNVQGINDNGLAVGFYSTDGVHQHGFTWDTKTNNIVLLGDPSTARTSADGLTLTQFLGVNDNNEAVGYYQTNNGSQFGFTYNLNSNTYSFLDDPLASLFNGVQITQITGVDTLGDLSGFYLDANGFSHGFFAAAVPEPGCIALLVGTALTGAGMIRRRRAQVTPAER